MQALKLGTPEEMDNLLKDLENNDPKEVKTSPLNIQSLCKDIDFDEEIKELSPKKNTHILKPFTSSEKKSPYKRKEEEKEQSDMVLIIIYLKQCNYLFNSN